MVNLHYRIKESHQLPHCFAAMAQQRAHLCTGRKRREEQKKGESEDEAESVFENNSSFLKGSEWREGKVKIKNDLVVPQSLPFFPLYSEKWGSGLRCKVQVRTATVNWQPLHCYGDLGLAVQFPDLESIQVLVLRAFRIS